MDEDSSLDQTHHPESTNLLGDKNSQHERINETKDTASVSRKKCFITVEPVLFLAFFGSNISGMNQYLYILEQCHNLNQVCNIAPFKKYFKQVFC